MNKTLKRFLLVLIIFLFTFTLSSCIEEEEGEGELKWVDYVSECKLDQTSSTKKMHATVVRFIDGDTTHFEVNDDFFDDHLLKARYLGIDTPESTGKVQPYGKKASKFTREHLETAEDIILESSADVWMPDTTNTRYLVWVWYKPKGETDYRLLNLELIQNGLSNGKNYSTLSYGSYFSSAYTQALNFNLGVVGNVKDDEFWYNGAQEITLKELRLNPEEYDGTRVRFECTVGQIVSGSGYTVYVYDKDAESGYNFGFQVYCGFNSYDPLEVVGNRVSLCGMITYYETGHIYQMSDIQISVMRRFPNDTYTITPYEVTKDFLDYHVGDILTEEEFNKLDVSYRLNVSIHSEDQSNEYIKYALDTPEYLLVQASDLNGNTKVTIPVNVLNEETEEYETVDTEVSKPLVLLHSLIEAQNLTITKVSITKTANSYGAATFTCTDSSGNTISVRTAQLRDASGQIVDFSGYQGKIINAKGILDYYSFDDEEINPNGYQLKVFDFNDLTIVR